MLRCLSQLQATHQDMHIYIYNEIRQQENAVVHGTHTEETAVPQQK
jgi:hypothetical protein